MNGLIYNQDDTKDISYGLRSSAKTGCGWIAIYNALQLLGAEEAPETIIRELQKMAPLLHGNAGTLCFAPKLFFSRRGYATKLTANPGAFDRLAEESDVLILFYYWHRKYQLGAHFVTIYRENGLYYSLNTYMNSHTPTLLGRKITDFTKKQHACMLLGIKKSR